MNEAARRATTPARGAAREEDAGPCRRRTIGFVYPGNAVAQNARPEIDDAVPIAPEDLRVVVPVPHSSTACAGAAAGFVLRRIAYRAGAYAPGIQEYLFSDLTTPTSGRTVESVATWMGVYGGDLHYMGYRLLGRRVVGERTEAIVGWVRDGKGFRGAVLATEHRRLHAGSEAEIDHAVGLAVDRLDARAAEDVIVVDPWPGEADFRRDRTAVPPGLELAHRAKKYAAVLLYWAGYA